MTRNQFLALWSLKSLNDQAFQRYKVLGYMRRERVLPDRDESNNAMINDEFTWQNLIETDEWYEQWQNRVESHLSSFRENSTKYLLAFQNVKLRNWTATSANKLEKQMEYLSKLLSKLLLEHDMYVLFRSHFDVNSRSLYILQVKDRKKWTVKSVDFSKTSRPTQILQEIYKSPLEHHDFDDLEFVIGDKNDSNLKNDDRSLYYALKNINKKINKDLSSDVGLLETENNQVWVSSLHV